MCIRLWTSLAKLLDRLLLGCPVQGHQLHDLHSNKGTTSDARVRAMLQSISRTYRGLLSALIQHSTQMHQMDQHCHAQLTTMLRTCGAPMTTREARPVTSQTRPQESWRMRETIDTTASTICMGEPNLRKSRLEWPPAASAIRLVCMARRAAPHVQQQGSQVRRVYGINQQHMWEALHIGTRVLQAAVTGSACSGTQMYLVAKGAHEH